MQVTLEAASEMVKRLEVGDLMITTEKIVETDLFVVPPSSYLTNVLIPLKLQNRMAYAAL